MKILKNLYFEQIGENNAENEGILAPGLIKRSNMYEIQNISNTTMNKGVRSKEVIINIDLQKKKKVFRKAT